MNRTEAVEYAERWIDNWNRRDVEAVLAHFDEDVTFSSPTAVETVGAPVVRGKTALRAYWLAALQRVKSLRFSLLRVVWDSEGSELAIIYDRLVNDRNDRASEILHFDPAGRVVRGEVFYGVTTG
jgi:ketosteroid isomerase-like protein